VVKTLDGKEVNVLVYTTPIRDDDGEVVDVIEMSTDITVLKNLEKQLKDSQSRYHQLFEEVPCFISIQDKDLRIVEANRMFCEAFGRHLGCKCYNVYKHREEECYPCIVKQTFNDGKTHIHEEVVTSEDGRQMNVLVSTMPIRNADSEIEHVIEMSTDITQIRNLQSKLESTGLLISSISHGLKGLLSSLDGGFYLVNSGLEKDDQERVRKGWEMAERNVGRIRSMVLDILYYAKDREPDYEALSPNDIVNEVSDLISAKANSLKIELKIDIDKSAAEFEADHKAIRSLLINLLENSIDACRVDSQKDSHEVRLLTRSSNEQIIFEIEDNGIGMDQETKDKAFSLFFSSKGTEGTGLGLFISSKIAQEHGGKIELESEVNKGTRFTVKLPKKRVAQSSQNS
jgi:PAS domain S-box-containing protein